MLAGGTVLPSVQRLHYHVELSHKRRSVYTLQHAIRPAGLAVVTQADAEGSLKAVIIGREP